MFVKKLGKGIRLCVNYYKLNAITKKDRYSLLLINETMASVASCKIMTKLNIQKAFNRIRITTTKDEDLTTFCTLLGNFKSKVLPFRLCNKLATFQRYINKTLFDYLNVFCTAYINNILIYSQNAKEHEKHVKQVF
jgi:hypothetical protein